MDPDVVGLASLAGFGDLPEKAEHKPSDGLEVLVFGEFQVEFVEIGRASCRERV